MYITEVASTPDKKKANTDKTMPFDADEAKSHAFKLVNQHS